MYFIVVYDINTISKGGAKRLRKIFKTMKKYLIHIQRSVFEGELSKAQYENLKVEVGKIIDKKLDSVIYFKSREIRWLEKHLQGIKENKTDYIV